MLDADRVHRDLVAELLALQGGPLEKLHLVARLYNDVLLGGAAAKDAYVFIPDLHLVSAAAQGRYDFGFHQVTAGRKTARDRLLGAVGDLLLRVKTRSREPLPIRTVLLGDFLDLWREREAPQEDVTAMTARILRDNPAAERCLARFGSGTLAPRLTIGNHEHWGADGGGVSNSVVLRHARRAHVLRVGGRETVVATHGDLFDWFEQLPLEKLKDHLLEVFGTGVRGQSYALDRTSQGHAVPGLGGAQGGPPVEIDEESDSERLPEQLNVWEVNRSEKADLEAGHRLLPLALECAEGLRKGSKKSLRLLELDGYDSLPELRTIVIGHSHHARLCLFRDPNDTSRNLVLADCGAWVESCQLGSSAESVPSCQIGVLCGGDFRIYQLTPAEA